MRRFALGLAFTLATAPAALAQPAVPPGPAVGPPAAPAAVADSCHVGAYRLTDGRVIDVGPAMNGGVRWRTMEGLTGRQTPQPDGSWKAAIGLTEKPDTPHASFGACGAGEIRFDGVAGRKVDLVVTETTFEGAGGIKLAGRLVMPAGTKAVPISVNVHGSENTSAVRNTWQQRAWPAQGVGWFVYDKRGTGASQGKYTQDFHVLSDDAAAAAREARRLAGKRVARLGFDGGSQAGWIIPLAATKVAVDYAVIRYGMAESPLGEDRAETLQDLAEKGWGPDVLAKAREVTDATGKVMASHFKGGWEELRAVKAKYMSEPWFKDLKGEFTGDFARFGEEAIKLVGPQRDTGTTWEHDPLPVLRQLKTPILWILAGADREAPIEGTRAALATLMAEGRPITVLQFPDTDHGMVEFTQAPDGKRSNTRFTDGYHQAVLDFSRSGRLGAKPYGRAERLKPLPSSPRAAKSRS